MDNVSTSPVNPRHFELIDEAAQKIIDFANDFTDQHWNESEDINISAVLADGLIRGLSTIIVNVCEANGHGREDGLKQAALAAKFLIANTALMFDVPDGATKQ